MIIRNKFNGYAGDGTRLYPGGGGGPSSSTSYQTNIPEYARPYVEQMLGSTQKQIFTGTGSGKDFKPTGFNPYTPYGSTYEKDETGAPLKDPSGNIMYTNTARQQAQSAVAPQTYGQQAATFDINNYRNPNQTTAASQMTADLAGRSAASGYYSPMQAERFQLGAPQQVRTDSFNMPGVSQGYMSPYMQNVVNSQQREARRAGEIQRNQNQGQAVQQGAFGGSRQAILEAERQRNLGTQLGDIQAQGLQQAYTQGQGQFNTEQNAYMQAQQANQQANMQTGVQNLQAQQDAQRQQEQSRQFGANLGLQGYGQAMQGAAQLGQLGQQQYGQEMGRIQAMSDMGAKEQAQEQAIINQQIQNYATQQQYPYMQLGIMSNMLRGLPMQAGTTNMYQAQPMGIQQAVGLAGALNSFNKKEGGVIKMAGGGVAGVDPYKLSGMAGNLSDAQLAQEAQQNQDNPLVAGIMNDQMKHRADIRARTAAMPKAAGGGMIAFAEGSKKAITYDENPFEKDRNKETKGQSFPLKDDSTKEKKPVTPTEKVKEKAAPKGESDDYFSGIMKNIAPTLAKFNQPDENDVALQEELKRQQVRAGMSPKELMDEQRQFRKEAGVPENFTNKLRKTFTEQLDNMANETKEQQKLREAQAWAIFGSTPGPLLKVGLQAMGSYISDTIEDTKQRKKMMNELNKSIFELDHADYLESVGMAKEGLAERKSSLNGVMEIRAKLAAQRERGRERELTAVTSAATKAAEVAGDIKEARIRSAGTGGGSDFKDRNLTERQISNAERAFQSAHKKDLEYLSSLDKSINFMKDGEQKNKLTKQRDDLKQKLDQSKTEIFRQHGVNQSSGSSGNTAPSGKKDLAGLAAFDK
jgi:hypothetical protein